jgi:hypothetical protein
MSAGTGLAYLLEIAPLSRCRHRIPSDVQLARTPIDSDCSFDQTRFSAGIQHCAGGVNELPGIAIRR